MTFNPDADISNHRVRKSGRGAKVAGGAVGVGGIIALILALVTGGDFSQLLPMLGGSDTQEQAEPSGGTGLEKCQTGEDANTDDDCRLAGATLVLDSFWEQNVSGYSAPEMVIVEGSTSTPCGTASNAAGPFYCPSNQTVYIDPTFWQLMRDQFGASAGNLAQIYVLAHEWGHHVQYIKGVMRDHPNNGSGPDSNGVRTELQADCYAGAWVAHASEQKDDNGQTYMKAPTEAELVDALNAASAVGDDNIQKQSGGFVNPESWTHGSSEQRQRWFATGYQYGVGACNTFDVSGADL
ncbi:neutral zinc metallopeptidase [Microbacterium mitrae]|uniref:Neutral zinc metallopeptidase n=1 Tax=Microbacterium mitrae TaxID=664640 RepID=A0A5C8HQY2_9MICO|nr:neutral zinc metallopeptidase [Microbacterium mitrae]TXK06550.1 neutral zinc metallopeptidase [Microbacterium mitrae]